MIEIERWPGLREPVLVVALSGWVDAGFAGAGAATLLSEHLGVGARFGRLPLDDVVDLRATRPTVDLVDGVTRSITWPAIEFAAGNAGHDVVVASGPEPSIRWRSVTEELVELAGKLGAIRAYTLGGMPTAVSHRRSVQVHATASSREFAQELGALRPDYTGPTGIQTVVQTALGHAGIPTAGLWAQVPYYVAANPSPPAIGALLRSLGELAGVQVPLHGLDARTDEYVAQVDSGLAEHPDVEEVVAAIEAGTTDNLPTGDELASEIERFLREQP